MQLTSEQVRSKEFNLARGGYNPDDVQGFLNDVADRLDSIRAEPAGAAKESLGVGLISQMSVLTFGQSRKGYAPAEVDEFIDQLSEQVHRSCSSI